MHIVSSEISKTSILDSQLETLSLWYRRGIPQLQTGVPIAADTCLQSWLEMLGDEHSEAVLSSMQRTEEDKDDTDFIDI